MTQGSVHGCTSPLLVGVTSAGSRPESDCGGVSGAGPTISPAPRTASHQQNSAPNSAGARHTAAWYYRQCVDRHEETCPRAFRELCHLPLQ